MRDRLIAADFKHWRDELAFFLDFANMIRARSPLFLSQLEGLNHRAGFATIAGVDHVTNSITVDSLEANPVTETWSGIAVSSKCGKRPTKVPMLNGLKEFTGVSAPQIH